MLRPDPKTFQTSDPREQEEAKGPTQELPCRGRFKRLSALPGEEKLFKGEGGLAGSSVKPDCREEPLSASFRSLVR